MNISNISALVGVSVALLASSCSSDEGATRAAAPVAGDQAARPDPHSFSRPDQVRVNHVSLDLDVDFDARALAGTAALDITRANGADELVLDTRGLAVAAISDEAGAPLPYRFADAVPLLGQALTIELGEQTKRVVVRYRTTDTADALQWLTPNLTAGGEHPYLFTQGQAILTRTWIPLQDSPGVRITYDATVRVPKELRAVMSAEQSSAEGELQGDTRSFRFDMKQPIPPYLIALAVGDLAFRELGPRTGVYSEPSVVDAAAAEFSDVESMMTAVEKLYGPYRWGRYDILVLPPSFPFGGMENPRLTFLSPTVIAGDKSLVSIVAHELAHSWSGNLVTNSTWRDFWLNEGFTTYIENRILEEVYGEKRAKLIESLGRRDLLEELSELGPTSDATRMSRDLGSEDPDDSINSIPYDKGSAFLRMLEHAVGRERFDAFLRQYFDDNAFASMTSERFLKRLRAALVKGDAQLEQRLQLETWVYGVGLPDNAPEVSSEALTALEAAANAFANGAPLAEVTSDDYTSLEWVLFLRSLPRDLPAEMLAALDAARGLSKSGNSEIRFEWLKLSVANQYEPALPSLEDFLLSQGRRRLVRPLYEKLVSSEWGKEKARVIYTKARGRYHPLTVETLDALFEKAGASL